MKRLIKEESLKNNVDNFSICPRVCNVLNKSNVQVRIGKVRLGQVRFGQVRLGLVRLGQVWLGQVYMYGSQVRCTCMAVRLGQVRLEKVWLGQAFFILYSLFYIDLPYKQKKKKKFNFFFLSIGPKIEPLVRKSNHWSDFRTNG